MSVPGRQTAKKSRPPTAIKSAPTARKSAPKLPSPVVKTEVKQETRVKSEVKEETDDSDIGLKFEDAKEELTSEDEEKQ